MAVHGLQWLSSLWENNLEILASQHIMEIGKSTWYPHDVGEITKKMSERVMCQKKNINRTVPSGKLTVCELENGPVDIVDLPMNNCDFPYSFMSTFSTFARPGNRTHCNNEVAVTNDKLWAGHPRAPPHYAARGDRPCRRPNAHPTWGSPGAVRISGYPGVPRNPPPWFSRLSIDPWHFEVPPFVESPIYIYSMYQYRCIIMYTIYT